MNKEIKVPLLSESLSSATLASILPNGSYVKINEQIAELETEKTSLVISAPASGIISGVNVKVGDEVTPEQLLCLLDESAQDASKAPKEEAKAPQEEAQQEIKTPIKASPVANNLVNNNGLDLSKIEGSGKAGMVTKPDVVNYVNTAQTIGKTSEIQEVKNNAKEETQTVRMSAIRRTIAKRLKEAQNTAAILTTFNEVDMFNIMEMRKKFQDDFVKKHGVKLGFMSLFVKAACLALQEIPMVNAQIDGDNIIYKNFCHIGVAIGSEKGLVVPVLRNCESLSFAEIEKEIIHYAGKAKNNKLTPSDFTGGTFTISNGGTYGSMLSTPIINPPQSAILGMHNIVERPVVINGAIVIRPIMYLALSYDHRIVDGKDAVTFLVKIKNYIENPQRILLEI